MPPTFFNLLPAPVGWIQIHGSQEPGLIVSETFSWGMVPWLSWFCGDGRWCHPGVFEKNRMKPPIVDMFTDGVGSNARLDSINDPEIIQQFLR